MSRKGRRTVGIVAVGLAGLLAAVGIGLAANAISGDSVGLSAEPLSPGETLAPPAARGERDGEDRRRRGDGEESTTPTTAPPPAATVDDDGDSGRGGDSDGDSSGPGSGDDDSSGRGRGRGRGRGGDDD